MALLRGFAPQLRVCEGELGAVRNRREIDLDARGPTVLVRLAAERPAPAHHDPARWHQLQVFAAGLVVLAVERSKVDAVRAADAGVDLRADDWHLIRPTPPPGGDAFRRRHRLEDDRGTRSDAADEREAPHRAFPATVRPCFERGT